MRCSPDAQASPSTNEAPSCRSSVLALPCCLASLDDGKGMLITCSVAEARNGIEAPSVAGARRSFVREVPVYRICTAPSVSQSTSAHSTYVRLYEGRTLAAWRCPVSPCLLPMFSSQCPRA